MPPVGSEDPMFYSTVSSLDRKPSMSSDDEGDIYCHTAPPAGSRGDAPNCSTNQTEKTTDGQLAQEKDTHKADQVRQTHRLDRLTGETSSKH